jgi:hypothetical protein
MKTIGGGARDCWMTVHARHHGDNTMGGDGVRKPRLGGWVMVYKHRPECAMVRNPPRGRWEMVYKNRRGMGARWRTKTVGRMGDGVQKLPWDGFPMVRDNYI